MARFEVYRDNDKLFRWRLRGGDDQLLAESCQGYFNRSDCENAVSLVRSVVPRADIILDNT